MRQMPLPGATVRPTFPSENAVGSRDTCLHLAGLGRGLLRECFLQWISRVHETDAVVWSHCSAHCPCENAFCNGLVGSRDTCLIRLAGLGGGLLRECFLQWISKFMRQVPLPGPTDGPRPPRGCFLQWISWFPRHLPHPSRKSRPWPAARMLSAMD